MVYETRTMSSLSNEVKPEIEGGHLFICIGRNITEHILKGHQELGRPDENGGPAIKIANRYVSRHHGYFDTVNGKTVYTAQKTTNGIQYQGRFLEPNERIKLKDGDELFIPSVGEDEADSFMLVYAASPMRINIWHELQQTGRDPLTGMYNRSGFEMWWLQHHLNKDYHQAALFMLDIDDFKQINDTFGHNMGDKALQLTAGVLMDAVRYEHQVCRWGGDEFIGIIPGTMDNIERRLERITEEIRKAGQDLGVPMECSIGYADIHTVPDVLDIEALINLADQAMYRIKRDGKHGISCYTLDPFQGYRPEEKEKTGELSPVTKN